MKASAGIIFALAFFGLISFVEAQLDVVDVNKLKSIAIPIHVFELILGIFIAYMALKFFRPVTPSQRFKIGLTFEEITKTKPEKSLISSLNKTSGRSRGKVTVKGKGGGHKRNFRYLILRDDVLEAVRDDKFRIYAIENFDEGIEILTGVKAGIQEGTVRSGEKKGMPKFEEGTVNYFVFERLKKMNESQSGNGKGKK